MNLHNTPINYIEYIKHLRYPDIINLCQSNSKFRSICQSDSTWIYLIERDFLKNYGNYINSSLNADSPKKLYQKLWFNPFELNEIYPLNTITEFIRRHYDLPLIDYNFNLDGISTFIDLLPKKSSEYWKIMFIMKTTVINTFSSTAFMKVDHLDIDDSESKLADGRGNRYHIKKIDRYDTVNRERLFIQILVKVR